MIRVPVHLCAGVLCARSVACYVVLCWAVSGSYTWSMTPAQLIPYTQTNCFYALDMALSRPVIIMRSDTVPRIQLLDVPLRTTMAEDIVMSVTISQQGRLQPEGLQHGYAPQHGFAPQHGGLQHAVCQRW